MTVDSPKTIKDVIASDILFTIQENGGKLYKIETSFSGDEFTPTVHVTMSFVGLDNIIKKS